ncbi:MAG: glycine--tRNA ligase [Candidatus Helarchaeales archaeon]
MSRLDEFKKFLRRKKIYQPSPSIYESIAGFYEFGPFGIMIKNKLVNVMRSEFQKFNFWEVEFPLIMPPKVWEASGHLERFVDKITTCGSCNNIYRIDKLVEEHYPDLKLINVSDEGLRQFLNENEILCPKCKSRLTEVSDYNLMIEVSVAGKQAYLRPETATTTYLAFKDYFKLFREQMPIKIFQFGKAYRNEITARQGLIRTREFEQFEGQIFILKEQEDPYDEFKHVKDVKLPFWSADAQVKGEEPSVLTLEETIKKKVLQKEAFAYCFAVAHDLLKRLELDLSRFRIRQHLPDERAHYAHDAWDLEILTDQFGWVEICGIHDRGDYDLDRHQKYSKTSFEVRNSRKEKEIPQILEIAFGVGRLMYCLLEQKFTMRDGKNLLLLPKELSPIQCAVFPLMNKDGLGEIAAEINRSLVINGITSILDLKGSIGKRYARMDEIGTPYCFTVDYQTKEDNTVTIRDRDDTSQVRVSIPEIPKIVQEKFLKKG